MTIPNLAGVITKADIDTKGTGSYAAAYVNWAKVAHLLHEHAPGWQFHLRPNTDGGVIWQAPDGTALVHGYFTSPDGEETAEFPFPAMDNRNNPIPCDKVSARVLSDTHRRALAAASAFTFGLAYELWAKEEVENPHREEEAPAAKPQTVKKTPTPTQTSKPAATKQPSPEPAAVEPPLASGERDEILAVLREMFKSNKTAFERFNSEYRAAFNVPETVKTSDHIQTKQHGDFAQQFFASLPIA